MRSNARIAISLPHIKGTKRHLSLKIKQEVDSAPSVYQQPDRMLVISDLEGDFVSFAAAVGK